MADEGKHYCGKGKAKESKFGQYLNIGIKAEDLPQPSEKGYIWLNVTKMKEPDKYGNEYTVYWLDKKQAGTTESDTSGLPF